VIINRAKLLSESPFNQELAFFKTPDNTAFIRVRIGNSLDVPSTNSIDISSISLHRVIYQRDIAEQNIQQLTPYTRVYTEGKPQALNAGGVQNVHLNGEILYYPPTAGGYLGVVCTSSGNPGIWKEFGLIQE